MYSSMYVRNHCRPFALPACVRADVMHLFMHMPVRAQICLIAERTDDYRYTGARGGGHHVHDAAR